MTLLVLFGTFLLGLLLSLPVVLSLVLASGAAILWKGALPGTVVPQQMVASIDSAPLLAIPLFILFGELVSSGSLGRRLIDFCQALVGWLRGGLAHANVVASMFFGGISGAATADTAAIGSIMIPAMKRANYPAAFAAVITCTSSVMGNMIPPTIDLILYGWLTGTPIDRLFAGGLVPGLLVGVALMLTAHRISVRHDYGIRQPFRMPTLARTFLAALPALVMPVLIIGGIFGGFVTVNEAAALAIVYGLLVTVVLYRDLGPRDMGGVIARATVTIGSVMLLIAAAKAFGWIMTVERVPQMMSEFMLELWPTAEFFAITVILISLFSGLFLTPATALIILTPIFAPISRGFAYDPVHFGLLLISSLALGHVTPPVGLTLFIGSSISEVPVERLVRPLLPFFATLVVVVLLIAFIPPITLFLPRLLMG